MGMLVDAPVDVASNIMKSLNGLKDGFAGLNRALAFWTAALPIILDYKGVEQWKDDELKKRGDDKASAIKREAKQRREVLHERYAPQVLELCLKLRGVYLKMGQVFSTMPIAPKAYRTALRVLQDGVPPKSPAEIHKFNRPAQTEPQVSPLLHLWQARAQASRDELSA